MHVYRLLSIGLHGFKVRIHEALFLLSVNLRLDRSSTGRRSLVALLFAYKDRGRPGRSWPFVQDYITTYQDEDLVFQLGYLQMEFGMAASSVSTFWTLLDRNLLRGIPIESALVAHLVEALNRRGKPGKAIDVFENVIDVSSLKGPTDSLHFNVGNSYQDANRIPDAVRCYETALSLRQENTGRILHNLGDCYYKLQDDDAALKCYEMALERADEPLEVAFEERAVGDAYFAMGRHDEATEYYRRAGDHGDAKAEQRIADVEADAMLEKDDCTKGPGDRAA